MVTQTHPFEARRPKAALPASRRRQALAIGLGAAAFLLGLRYLAFRWVFVSLDMPWFAVPVALAESFAFACCALNMLTSFRTEDTPWRAAPVQARQIGASDPDDLRPLSVDVFIATYNEDPDLLALSIADAKAMRAPEACVVQVYVLDDGRRGAVRALAERHGVRYLSRPSNEGYKAGNLRNAMDHTCGDLIVILDADTRPFPSFLEQTLGYFCDPAVAWVQTPQWFYDLDEGQDLGVFLAQRLHLGCVGRALGRALELVLGPLRVGRDLLGNDPSAFYELVQRRRNWANASFCCGAGSVHRREAVMTAALAALGREVEGEVAPLRHDIEDRELFQHMEGMVASEAARGIDVNPYEFHVSEDIFTSLLLHASQEPRFRSVFHPTVLCKMLSPQDLKSWSIQRFKYAGGTLDIFFRHARKRLRGLSPWQALMYGATVAGYLTPLWLLPLFASSLAFLYFGISTVRDEGGGLLGYLLPFLFVDRLARMVWAWGVDTARDEGYAMASFWLHLQALLHVLRGRPIKFQVTPKMRQHGSVLQFVWPHCVLIMLFAGGVVALLLRAHRDPIPAAGLVLHCGFALSSVRALSLPVRAALSPTNVGAT